MTVREYVESCGAKTMKSAASRKKLADKLATLADYWSSEEMLQFVEEMRGLDFYNSEDRAIFCEFFYSWIKEARHESFNS